MGKKAFLSIGFKLTAIVSLLLAISLGGLTLLATLYFSNEVELTLKSSTLEQVDFIASKMETEFDAAMAAGRLAAAALDGGLVYNGSEEPATAEILRVTEHLRDVLILRRTGGELVLDRAADRSYQPLSPPSKRPALRMLEQALGTGLTRAFSGGIAVCNLSPEYGQPVVAIAFPWLMQSSASADSILVVVWSTEALLSSLASREPRDNYLVDTNGFLLAHASAERVLARESVLDIPLVRDALAGGKSPKQFEYRDDSGAAWIGAWRSFMEGRVFALSTTERDIAFEGVRFLRRQNILISIIILASSIIFVLLFSKTLTVPVKRLVAGAERIRAGDFSTRVPTRPNDEIGQLATSFNAMATGLEERDKIKSAFGKFVNKEVAEKVLKGEVALGGESRTVSIFFSDIRSFTTISEQLTPHEVVDFLNEYMTLMVECINRTHGTVDKYIGDAIMATWGVPTSRGNDTENAISSALLMRRVLADFNRNRGGPRKPIIKIGCGINTGEVIVGQIGSTERMEYTCIGDAVNLASRIESLNKLFHTDILISQRAYEQVRDIFVVEPMKMIRVKGKEEHQRLYAVLGKRADPECLQSIAALREELGLEPVDLRTLDPDREERKYELIK